jgi:hypothetical protein
MVRLVVAAEMASKVSLNCSITSLSCAVSGYPAAHPSVNCGQHADRGVSVFAAGFTILVAVAIVETGLAHAALQCAHTRELPPAGIEWQLNYAREMVSYGR